MGEAALITSRNPKSHTKPQKRLTDADKAFALRYHSEGLTQVQIAQRLDCDQATISRWLSTCQDTTVEAAAYFRGRALPMAEKIVKKGRPSDLIKALQGVGVLMEERTSGLVIQIGGGSGDIQVAVLAGTFAPSIAGAERRSEESLAIQDGSDKQGYVDVLR